MHLCGIFGPYHCGDNPGDPDSQVRMPAALDPLWDWVRRRSLRHQAVVETHNHLDYEGAFSNHRSPFFTHHNYDTCEVWLDSCDIV